MQTVPEKGANSHQFLDYIQESNIFKKFFDHAPVMMGIVDLEQNEIRHIVDNQTSADFFGVPLKDLPGKRSAELGVPNDRRKFWITQYRISEATSRPVKFEYYHNNKHLSATVNYIGKTEFGNSRFSYIVTDISELKVSQNDLETKVNQRTNELEKQMAQLEAVLESVSDGILVYDNNNQVVLINEAEARICGYSSPEEMKKDLSYFQTIFQICTLDGKILDPALWPVSRIMKGESLKDVQLKAKRIDTGQEWVFSFSGQPVYDSQGHQILSVCISKDITKEARTQNKLLYSEARYRHLFINNPMPMYVYNTTNKRIIDVNESALRFYRYSKEELLGLSVFDISIDGDNKQIKKDGEIAVVEIHERDLLIDGEESKLVLVNDVTHREEVERSLNETVDQLEEALKNVSDYKFALDQASILATTDANGVITYVNDKFCEISQYSRDELIGKNHRVVNSGYHSKEFFRNFWDTIKNGKVWKGEICNKAKDGSIYWVDTVIVPFLDAYGRPYQYVAVRNDVTDRKAYEKALENAVNTRDEFLSIASHELKTPLTSLKLHTQLAIRHQDKPGRISKFLEQTDKQVHRLSVLIDDMLDISRIASGKLSIQKSGVDLVHLLHSVLSRVGNVLRQSGCEIKLTLPESCFGIWDHFRIEQVVTNLLTNAAKYGAGKPVEIDLKVEGEFAVLSIKDYGIGIRFEDRERIFQRFERAISASEVSGLGLGLYISCQIIKMHGGSITVESEPGKGSTFIVCLPL